jgi:NADPH:quinone reductase-like Zn-dependent oxidoreductase
MGDSPVVDIDAERPRVGDEAPQPMSISAMSLIGKHVTVRGFSAADFDYATKVLPVIREAVPLVASGALFVPVAAVFELDDIQAAIQQVLRGGKVLLKIVQS